MPADMRRYHPAFRAMSASLRAADGRSGGACECVGQCGDAHDGDRCRAPNHTLIVRDPDLPASWSLYSPGMELWRAVRVVLTVAHLPGHAPEDEPDPARLVAMCQRCHNRMDGPMRRRNARATRRARKEAGQVLGPWVAP